MLSQMYVGIHVKYWLFLVDFSESWTCLTDFSKNTEVSDFLETRPLGVELHADRRMDGQTDMTKLIVAFRSSVNAPVKTFATTSFSVKPYICLLGEGARSLHS